MNDLTLANQSVLQSTVDPATSEEHPYDVLVVGAGPAGSSAAYHLSWQGAEVLLVDRLPFLRDKRCGDGIVTAALEELALMGLIEEVKALSKEAKQRFANIPEFAKALEQANLEHKSVPQKLPTSKPSINSLLVSSASIEMLKDALFALYSFFLTITDIGKSLKCEKSS